MRRVVVVGTGTGVGKTAVSCALLRALGRVHPSVRAMGLKPIETGITPDRTGSDAALLEAASVGFEAPSNHPLYALREPVSPHLAARLAGLPSLDIAAVPPWISRWQHEAAGDAASEPSSDVTRDVTSLDAARQRPFDRDARSKNDVCLVETAGALLSPLAPGVTNFDLALALEPATWILVGVDALGTLHDVTACLEVMSARGRLPDHVVLSAARVDASTCTNAAELEALGIVRPSAVLDRDGTGLDEFARALLNG
ncbi:MAG: dethiobiotin synthase [Myxococcota bacterium]